MAATRSPRANALTLAAVVAAWWLAGAGLVSSNDGSHLALARALALRGEAAIDPDRDLTLRVDVAHRAGRAYSDRPPGTAAAAMPAVWAGASLDAALASDTQATGRVHVRPAHRNFARTYAARLRDGPALVALQGTAGAVAVHVRLVGLVGLALLLWLLGDLGVSAWRARAVVAALGLASLWGPYSTALFSHVSAATLLLGLWVALRLDERGAGPWAAVTAGLLGAWAVSADYLLALWVVPWVATVASWRRWPLVLLGVAPVAGAVAGYHHAAFGDVWALGYDHQSNFAFARGWRSTFDRSPLHGLWVLFGAGRGAGLLARAPLWLLGLPGLGLVVARGLRTPRSRAATPAAASRTAAWVALASLPWLLALACHHTPWGGGTRDHRYLVPFLPVLAAGLAVGWEHADRLRPSWWRVTGLGLAAATLLSGTWVWSGWLAWRG